MFAQFFAVLFQQRKKKKIVTQLKYQNESIIEKIRK